MEKKNYWAEIANDHFVTKPHIQPSDGDILASISIDAWKTADAWEGGTVIAEVLLSDHGDILVCYKDPVARVDEAAQAAILEAKEFLKKFWENRQTEQRERRP